MTRPATPRRSLADASPIHPRRSSATLVALLVCLAAMTGAARAHQPAAGQTPVFDQVDPRWLPWLGCWQLVEETGAVAEAPDDSGPFADRVVVCLTPRTGATGADDDGVEVTTVADGERVLVETLLADGAQHQVEETACSGWRQNTWSGDGARLFTRAELACDGADMRRVSGVGLMTGAATWLDIELVETGGRGSVTVRRYRRASDQTTADAGATALPADLRDRARAAARLTSTSELSLDDVIEAGQEIEPTVVEAMLVETRASFALDGRAVLRLDDGGVPAAIIDLMVALSFPDEFVVDRPAVRAASSYGGGGGGFVDTYSPYGFNSWYPYYASPFGYYYGWSPYNSLYYYGPAASYIIAPSQGDGGATGRAYSGRGYTRVGVREPAPGPFAQPRGTSGTRSMRAGSSGGSASSGGSSGGGQASPSGYSRGGSSGRTAVARDR